MPFTLKASGSLEGNGKKRKCFPAEDFQANDGTIQCTNNIHIFSSLKSGELQFPDDLKSRNTFHNNEMNEFEPTIMNPSELPPPESPISSQIQKSMRGLTLISSPGSSFTPINRTPRKGVPSYSLSTCNTPDATERVRSVSLISSSTPNSAKHAKLKLFNEQVNSSSTSSMSRRGFMPLFIAPRDQSLGLPKIGLPPRNDEDSTLGTPKPGWLISPRFRQNPPSSENSCFVHWDSPLIDEQGRNLKPPVSCVDISEAGRSVSDSYRSLLCQGPNDCIDDYEYIFDDVTVESIDNHSHDDGFFLSDPSTITQNSGLSKRMKFVENEESPLGVTKRVVSKSIAYPPSTAKPQEINMSPNQKDDKVVENLSFPSGDNVVSATGKEVDTYLPNFGPDIMRTEKLDQHIKETTREDMITPPINNQRPSEPPLLKSRKF